MGPAAPGEGEVCVSVPSRAVRRLRRGSGQALGYKTLLVFHKMPGSSLEEAGQKFAWQRPEKYFLGKEDAPKSDRQEHSHLRGNKVTCM